MFPQYAAAAMYRPVLSEVIERQVFCGAFASIQVNPLLEEVMITPIPACCPAAERFLPVLSDVIPDQEPKFVAAVPTQLTP